MRSRQPTLSCPARTTQNSCDPMCRQCMLVRVSLCHCKPRVHPGEARYVRLGETSSMLVALRMLMASSDSCLKCCLAQVRTYPATEPSKRLSQSVGMMMVIYVLPHVHIARASVERHLARRELFLGLVVGGRRYLWRGKDNDRYRRRRARAMRRYEVVWG
jgi:hypothetical protein